MAFISAPRGVIATPKDAKLSSLSSHLIERCLSFCEDEDLLRFSYTSKSFHETALRYLFSRNGSDKWLFGSMVSLNHLLEWSPCLTAALRSALFIQTLTWFDFDFYPDSKRLVDDVRHLKYFLQSLAHGVRIQFCFSRVENWVIKGGKLPSFDFDSWLVEFRELLSVAVCQGCSQLHVDSGGFFLAYRRNTGPSWIHNSKDAVEMSQTPAPVTLSSPSDAMPVSRVKKFSTITRIKNKISQKMVNPPRIASLAVSSLQTEIPIHSTDPNSERKNIAMMDVRADPPHTYPVGSDGMPGGYHSAPTLVPFQFDLFFHKLALLMSHNTLTHFGAHSPLIFEPPLLEWTIDVLCGSTALEELSFCNISLPSSIWSELLYKVHLPKLKRFTINHTWIISQSTGVPLSAITQFLQRHTGITSLELSGLDMDDVQFANLNPEGSLLPKLQNLVAHPHFIQRFFSHHNASLVYTLLQSITIGGEYYAPYGYFPQPMAPFNFTTFNDAFPLIATHPNVTTLTFHLPCDNPHLIDRWITLNLTLGTSSPIVTLINIKRLVIDLCQFTPLEENTCYLVPRFLNLFPAVESVTFQGIPLSTKSRLEGQGFRREMEQRCHRVKSYFLEGEEIRNRCPGVVVVTGEHGVSDGLVVARGSDEPRGA